MGCHPAVVKENKGLVISQEAVFVAAFLIWAIVRGANPEISGTEKPMELAFINGIYRRRLSHRTTPGSRDIPSPIIISVT
jgi:uncharacterized membrane protein